MRKIFEEPARSIEIEFPHEGNHWVRLVEVNGIRLPNYVDPAVIHAAYLAGTLRFGFWITEPGDVAVGPDATPTIDVGNAEGEWVREGRVVQDPAGARVEYVRVWRPKPSQEFPRLEIVSESPRDDS